MFLNSMKLKIFFSLPVSNEMNLREDSEILNEIVRYTTQISSCFFDFHNTTRISSCFFDFRVVSRTILCAVVLGILASLHFIFNSAL